MKRRPTVIRPEPIPIEVDGMPCLKVALTRGMWVLIDIADAPQVLAHFWCVEEHGSEENKLFYAMRVALSGSASKKVRESIKLHQFLLNTELDIDHKNGDGLDCRRCNLRPATDSQNQGNRRKQQSSSRFKGVTWNRRLGKWVSQIGQDGTRKHLGCFSNESEAGAAYNSAALAKWGEFARLNPIP